MAARPGPRGSSLSGCSRRVPRDGRPRKMARIDSCGDPVKLGGSSTSQQAQLIAFARRHAEEIGAVLPIATLEAVASYREAKARGEQLGIRAVALLALAEGIDIET